MWCRCNGFEGTTPLIEFLHKGAHISNLTGEKITESQAVCAVTAAAKGLNVSLTAFTVTPLWEIPRAIISLWRPGGARGRRAEAGREGRYGTGDAELRIR